MQLTRYRSGMCNCLCFAVHAERGICDPEAPTAFVAVDGSDYADTIAMCQPCAEAATAQHPRMRDMVVVGTD